MSALSTKLIGNIEPEPTRLPDPDPRNELSVQLTREFDAPVGLYDPSQRIWLVRVGVRAEDFPDTEACACTILGQGHADRPFLWRPNRAAGPTWLGFPVWLPFEKQVFAFVGFASNRDETASSTLPWGLHCPEPALLAWGQVVAQRLQSQSETRLAVPVRSPNILSISSQLIDSLIRRLRISDPPERFQRLAARAIREELNFSAVAWVPGSPREPLAIDGGIVGLTPDCYRSLIPESPREIVRLLEQPVPHGSVNAVVVAADRENASGWLVAMGPPENRAFLHEEIELLRSIAPLLAAQRSNARLYADLKDLLFGIIRALTSAIDAKDPYTSGHSERVARIAVRLGEELGMNPNQRGDLYLMGLLHDIGKIGIEDGVLKKPDKLTPDEYRQIQAHVKIGVHILSDLKKLHHLLPGVAHHHECMDGSGYPSGLAGEAIPLAARILAVADAFDAMSSSRPYRRRLHPAQIDDIFHTGAGKQWDPRVVEALFSCREEIERIRSKGLGESLRQVVGNTLGRTDGLS